MGSGYFKRTGYSGMYAAGTKAFQLYLRGSGRILLWRSDSDCRRCGRPAGGAVWPDLFYGRRGEKYIRDGLFFADEYRGASGIFQKPVYSKNGLVTTIAWGLDGKVNYALEGSIFVAGAAVQWLRDEMRLVDTSPDTEYMASKVKDTNGCYVVPAFTGLGAPYWDQYARGTIVGITRGVNKYHIIRATLESLAYQVYDVIAAMQADSGITLSTLKVDGGASANDFLMQFQADVNAAPVHRPVCVETTAMGAAYLAGLAVGYWKSKEEVIKNWEIDRVFKPEMEEEARNAALAGWQKAVKYSYGWAKED